MKIEPGQLLALTTGQYSDYCLMDHAKALQAFDVETERRLYLDSCPDIASMPGYKNASPDEFAAWLIRRGLIEQLDPGQVLEVYIEPFF